MDKKIKKKYIRKVTLLKYNDRRLIYSRTITTTREKLTIKVQCKTKAKKSVKKKCISKEKYPIFKAQLRDRIVPSCFRPKCSKKYILNTISRQDNHNWRMTSPGIKDHVPKNSKKCLSPLIEISDEDGTENLEYDNISSGTLSSFTEDEIDTLMESTRKRMKDLNTEWTLLPRQSTSSDSGLNDKDINKSTDSLDTLVLEEIQDYPEIDIKNEAYSPTMNPDKFYEPMETKNIIKSVYNIKNEPAKYIDNVVTKLEKDDPYFLPATNNFSIKQELYSDI